MTKPDYNNLKSESGYYYKIRSNNVHESLFYYSGQVLETSHQISEYTSQQTYFGADGTYYIDADYFIDLDETGISI